MGIMYYHNLRAVFHVSSVVILDHTHKISVNCPNEFHVQVVHLRKLEKCQMTNSNSVTISKGYSLLVVWLVFEKTKENICKGKMSPNS